MSGPRSILPALLALALGAGCAPRAPEMLVDHGAWEQVSEQPNPFSDSAPPESERECESLAVYNELYGTENSISIDLSGCNYAILYQPTLVDIPPGDTVVMRVWRDLTNFTTDEPTEMVVRVGDGFSWSNTSPNPGGSGLEYADDPVAEFVPAGAEVYWLVNTHQTLGARHGANTVNLIELSRNDPSWEEE